MTLDRPERAILWPQPQPIGERAALWAATFDETPSFSWDLCGGSTVTVDDFEASGNMVRFWVTVQHSSGRIIYEDDHIVINPPGLDADRNQVDVIAHVKEFVEEHLP